MTMEPMLFGVPYELFIITDLKSFLDTISKPYKPTSTRKILISILLDFEKSICYPARADVAIDIRFYFDSKNSFAALRAERHLLRTLRRISYEQNRRSQDKVSQGKAKISKEIRENISKTNLRKRKHSKISKGPGKPKKSKPKVPKFRECRTWFEDLPHEDFPNANIKASGAHGNSVYTSCIGAYVDAKVDVGGYATITCPMCPKELASDDVQHLWGSETCKRYGRLITRSVLPNDPTFHSCLAPDYGSGQCNDDRESCKMTDEAFKFAICTQHVVTWHTGHTCEKFDSETQKALAQTKQRDALQEPKDTSDIEKRGEQELEAEVGGWGTVTSPPGTEKMCMKPNEKEVDRAAE